MITEPVPGTRYRIKFADCCIAGKFDGVFIDKTVDEEDGTPLYRFDIGEFAGPCGLFEAIEDEDETP